MAKVKRQFSEKHRENLSKSYLGLHYSPKTEFKKGHKINLNRHNSPETEFKLGHSVSSELRNKIRKTHKGKKLSKKHKDKISKALKGRINWALRGKKLTKEHIKNALRRRIPSSLEEKFQGIISKYNLPYKFVGNGSFILGHYNPDFININNEKIAIEVYSNFYKQLDGRNIEKWKEERTKKFREFGWEVVYFNEVQVKEKYVLSVLGR